MPGVAVSPSADTHSDASSKPSRLSAGVDSLQDFIGDHSRLLVMTGAGVSTDSGIPDYRDRNGAWKRRQPVTLQLFMAEVTTRQRYWARSLAGWPIFAQAQPNRAHRLLARWELQERLSMLVTQNVDGLHQRAGHREVIDLHGRLNEVRCTACAWRAPREAWQQALLLANPVWLESLPHQTIQAAPDGDADIEDAAFARFNVPQCPQCTGTVKPDVVFFGETVPALRVEQVYAALARSSALLVVGSSLMVFSGFRFVRAAVQSGIPVAAIGLGRTRADDLLQFRVAMPCADALEAVSV